MNFCATSAQIWQLVGYALFVLKIVVPLIIIILGIIDFTKALAASKDDALNDAIKAVITRFIIGIAIFFIPLIISTIFAFIKSASPFIAKAEGCEECLLKPFGDSCQTYKAQGDQIRADQAASASKPNEGGYEIRTPGCYNCNDELIWTDNAPIGCTRLDRDTATGKKFTEELCKEVNDDPNRKGHTGTAQKPQEEESGSSGSSSSGDSSSGGTPTTGSSSTTQVTTPSGKITVKTQWKKLDGIDYIETIPEGETDNIPLVIFLHGIGEVGNPNGVINLAPVSFMTVGKGYNSGKFVFIAPVSPTNNWEDSYSKVKNIINTTVNSYKLNSKQIVIIGFSLGCRGLFKYVAKDPNFYSAAIAVSDDVFGTNAANDFKTTPLKAICGSQESFKTNLQRLVNDINNLGGNAQFYTAGTDHPSAQSSFLTNDLLTWALSQKRK